MRCKPRAVWKAWLSLCVLLVVPHGLAAQTKAPASGGASTAAMDALTAPIALYPDALIGQILQASTDVAALQKFSGWLGANASLKGTALQDVAQAAAFAACYIALAPFGQVVQMLVQKPEWAAQLGKAFVTDKTAVTRRRAKNSSGCSLNMRP